MQKFISIALTSLLATPIWAAEAPLPFETMTVQRHKVVQERIFDGTVDAVNQSTVSAETSGVVASLEYDVDDVVKQGAVLVTLKDVQQKAGVNQARAGESEALARLKQAQQEFDRIKGIYDRRLVAKSQLDSATAELKSAQARYNSAKAAVSSASDQADNTRVRAPYSGIVTQRHVELGEFVNVGQPLMTGISLDQLRVNVDVPQSVIADIRSKRVARVLSNLNGGTDAAVESLTFFPYADAESKTFKVRVNLVGGDSGLFPGMFVKVAFATGETEALVVPEAAVVHRSEVTGVYVVDENNLPRLRYVRLGNLTAEGEYTVLSGLADNERVALDPVAAGIFYKQQSQGAAHE